MRTAGNPTARAVAAALAAHGRIPRDIAAVLGVSSAAVSRRMRGETEFTAGELRKIAEWLGVPAGSLIELPAVLAGPSNRAA